MRNLFHRIALVVLSAFLLVPGAVMAQSSVDACYASGAKNCGPTNAAAIEAIAAILLAALQILAVIVYG